MVVDVAAIGELFAVELALAVVHVLGGAAPKELAGGAVGAVGPVLAAEEVAHAVGHAGVLMPTGVDAHVGVRQIEQ